MLEKSYGLNFFLKTPRKKTKIRTVYVRVTVNGIPKEASTNRKWDEKRWDQSAQRAMGTKEDAKTLNFFIDNMEMKVNQYRTEMLFKEMEITSQRIIDVIIGNTPASRKVLDEFRLHNDEMFSLVPKEFAIGTHERYVTALSHVREFIRYKFKMDDIEFRELSYQFIKDYEFYLKTVRHCSNNTALKYISNFKKIVIRALDREIITSDPFRRFKGKKTKIPKKPLLAEELSILENKQFSIPRLAVVRDIFVFQCYTGLAYIDAYQLKKSDIKTGVDGEQWIMSARQKSKSSTNIPLLPKAVEIMEKYSSDPLCIKRESVLPVSSNQKMNAYLKEIAELCGFSFILNTHKARRTFGSTVTLNNNVPIHIVKEMLGHHSVKQTEEYAITEHRTIGKEMTELKGRLAKQSEKEIETDLSTIERMEKEIQLLKEKLKQKSS